LPEGIDHLAKRFEPRIIGLTMVITVVNLLNNDGETPNSVNIVKSEIADISARAVGIKLQNILPRHHTRDIAGLTQHELHKLRIIILNPVGQRIAKIHERVADGANFPIQKCVYFCGVLFIQDAIVDAVVPMENAGCVFRIGLISLQPITNIFKFLDVIWLCNRPGGDRRVFETGFRKDRSLFSYSTLWANLRSYDRPRGP